LPKIDQPSPEPDRVWDEMKWGSASANPKPIDANDQWGNLSIKAKPTEWSVELLRDIEWKRFEDVCQKFYALKGIRSETTPLGPDGGIDIRLYQDESGKATSIVQCKAWGKRFVGVQPVRELLGVMAHEKIEKAFFMASGNFSDEAKAFVQSNPIILINGDMLVTMIKRLPATDQQSLLAFATEGDFNTPTCPSCGIKMRRVSGTSGRPDFWGCQYYPRCRQKLGMRVADRK
jgi:restriction system protein